MRTRVLPHYTRRRHYPRSSVMRVCLECVSVRVLLRALNVNSTHARDKACSNDVGELTDLNAPGRAALKRQ